MFWNETVKLGENIFVASFLGKAQEIAVLEKNHTKNLPLFSPFQVRWGDSYDGYGEHYWEYNHGPSAYEPEPYKEPAKPYVPAPTYVN